MLIFNVFSRDKVDQIKNNLFEGEREIRDVVLVGINPDMSYELRRLIEKFSDDRSLWAFRNALCAHFRKNDESDESDESNESDQNPYNS